MVKFSIIIPIYNTGRHLRTALQSVKNQSFGDWECICVNDGSTDGSREIIVEFAASDNRFTLIDQPNSGVSAARNTGLDAAQGEYITFLDHDDLLERETLTVYNNAIIQYQPDMVRAAYRYAADDYILPPKDKPENKPDNSQTAPETVYYDNPIDGLNSIIAKPAIRKWFYIWNCCIKREKLAAIRFDAALSSGGGEDILFMAQVWGAIGNFVQSPYISTVHRRTANSITRKFSDKHIEVHLITTAAIARIYRANPSRLNRYFYHNELFGCYYLALRKPIRKRQPQLIRTGQRVLSALVADGSFDMEQVGWMRRCEIKLFLRGHITACWLLSTAMRIGYNISTAAYKLGLQRRIIR